MVQIDREKTTPFLVQIFPSPTTQHNPDSAYSTTATPTQPLNLYAWKDTTIRELLIGVNSLKSIVNSTRYDLTLLYHNSNTQRFNSKHFCSGNYNIKDLTLTPSNNPKLEKTLSQCNFEVGDYLDLVHLSPPVHPSHGANPSPLYSDRNSSFPSRQPPSAPGGLRNQPFNPRNSFPVSNGGPRGAPGGPSRNGNVGGPMRGDGNAPAGAWGRNAGGGGGAGGGNGREDRGGRDGPPHRADTWAPNQRGAERNGNGGRGSFDSRDGGRDNNRRPFNTSNNNRRDSRSRSPARRPNNNFNNRRSPSRSRSRSRSRSPAPRKKDVENEDSKKGDEKVVGDGKLGGDGGDVEMS